MRSQFGFSGHGGRAGRLFRPLGTLAVLAVLASTAAMRPLPALAQMTFVVAGHVGGSPAAPGGAMLDVGTEVRDGAWGLRVGVGTDAGGDLLGPLASNTGVGSAWISDLDVGLNLADVPYAGDLLGEADPTVFLGAGGAGGSSTDAESGARERSFVPTWSLGARGGYPITRWLGLEVEARRRAALGDDGEDDPARLGWEYRAGLALRFGGLAARPLPAAPTRLPEQPARRAASAPRLVPAAEVVTAEPESEVDAAALVAARTLSAAAELVGSPYRWGGSTPAGFDCSGFIQFVFRRQGIELPRVSRDQARAGRAMPTSLENLAPGDLLFFAQGGPTIDHVAMYAGDGRIVHSSRSGYGVRYDELSGARGRYYARHLVAVRRVIDGTTIVSADDLLSGDDVPAIAENPAEEALEAEQADAAPPPESGR